MQLIWICRKLNSVNKTFSFGGFEFRTFQFPADCDIRSPAPRTFSSFPYSTIQEQKFWRKNKMFRFPWFPRICTSVIWLLFTYCIIPLLMSPSQISLFPCSIILHGAAPHDSAGFLFLKEGNTQIQFGINHSCRNWAYFVTKINFNHCWSLLDDVYYIKVSFSQYWSICSIKYSNPLPVGNAKM